VLITVLVVVAVALVSGCGSTDHSWRGEFDARLEGATASIEETLAEVGPDAAKSEYFQRYPKLSRELKFKSELIEGLLPAHGCSEVQLKGLDHIKSSALFTSFVSPPDYPWRMLRGDRVSLESEIHVLARLEREAETCE
jgi:hypothetical protein